MNYTTCENCKNPIGHLETPCVYKDHVVCSRCRQILIDQEPKPNSFVDPEINAQAGRQIARVLLWVVGAAGLYALFQLAVGVG